MKNSIIILVIMSIATACHPEKTPIEYGYDKCHYCKMTIVDKRFGSELVTRKGKVYMFDATECLVNFIRKEHVASDNVFMILTNTFDNPGELVQAEQCSFLISENMPSPMGMYINPFADRSIASEYQQSQNGKIFEWHELKEKLPEGF